MAIALGAGSIPANAGVIASCGLTEGYDYYPGDEVISVEPEWVQGNWKLTVVFMGTAKVEDVILTGKDANGEDWTRSASDYNATVVEVARRGSARHVLLLWGPVTEIYAFDTEKKSSSMLTQKSGLSKVTRAVVGKCE